MLKIIDLFSGASGLTEGFRSKKDFKFISHIEMDESACSSLKLRNIYYYLKDKNKLSLYSDYLQGKISKSQLYAAVPAKIISDILNAEINKQTMPSIFEFIDQRLKNQNLDGIIGGPPCQAYSTIGRHGNKAKKSTDERIYLYKHYLVFLKRYKPKFFVFENVKGLISFRDVKNDLLFPQILNEFTKAGYQVNYKIINAEDFGVPQKRERLFIIGHRKDLLVNKSFFDYLDKHKETPPLLKELFAELPKIKSGESAKEYENTKTSAVIQKYIRNGTQDVLTQHDARIQNKNDLEIYKLVLKAKQKGTNLKYDGLPKKLQTHANLTSFLDRYKALDYNSISHTVVAHIAKDGHYYIHPDLKQNRSITVREAARIQGFPDNFYFENSRTAEFKQIGNAVPPILSKKIATSIIQFLKTK
ncbi:DNA (cytosine-5)-methyltransferase 1 [Mycoplasmoides fastidiosum]|uniref:Cytosine-specific methyltransferase n=1 Tax=Mycoplasmoides fastidiosum TaxID=92758 RepID=A0ABU0LZ52_9BACT|nr:DNA cytosine methyltransferase [Mycoplasmoides fastidiosum]MDQ0513984.1 DNA (cytosine-5)-methyltransferase 1 [Mycoplasmoides fastidiosum]UUD37602.1 DNA cytosine methyltransferase [Mycoplasmoides fastidiosum]